MVAMRVHTMMVMYEISPRAIGVRIRMVYVGVRSPREHAPMIAQSVKIRFNITVHGDFFHLLMPTDGKIQIPGAKGWWKAVGEDATLQYGWKTGRPGAA
tara:strand:- start:1376 stop:1672 length:297 start_codon:yes stop_codon:yes gene_type:complete